MGMTVLLLYGVAARNKGVRMQKEKAISNEQIEKAYEIIARIIRDYGDVYLPIFKRLHEEKEARKAKGDLRNIALQIAQNK
jgi:pimeloyl-CoA synthetase